MGLEKKQRKRFSARSTKFRFWIAPVLALGALSCLAQETASGGGRWIRVTQSSKDKKNPMVEFVLSADAEDTDRHPFISIACPEPTKPPVVVYNTDVILAPTVKDPMNYFSPAIWALVKVDSEKAYRAEWDLLPIPDKDQKRVFLDRKTFHHLLTGSTIRMRFSDHYDVSYLDEFTAAGLNLNDLRETCGSKWFSREITEPPREVADKKDR